MENNLRIEEDIIGKMELPQSALYGIHTKRAYDNFSLNSGLVHKELIRAFGTVKLACAKTNRSLGMWKDDKKADAIEAACSDLASGSLDNEIIIDALQGGAGTSTNMNANEVIANRALELMELPHGSYEIVSPTDDINLHQSTNDTYPTALKLAAIRLLHNLEENVVGLQEAFQHKEKEFAHIVKIGRTQYQDAVLTTLGREMSAYAEAINRDRWRIYKCEERLRVINLGGTAIGTGLGAPRKYIFQVVDNLRALTGIGFARAENLIEATQNTDVFVEVSGILKALASSLIKITTDIRLMSSGPDAGIGEINIPQMQAGSSIMPGKVNPVIPESTAQACILVFGYDSVIAHACSMGSLELNAFLPLISVALLTSLSLLSNACKMLWMKCIKGITANEKKCMQHVETSTATATALIPAIGYEQASTIVKLAKLDGISIKDAVIMKKLLSEEEFSELITPEAVTRLGSPNSSRRKE